jgi:hypothetical protein
LFNGASSLFIKVYRCTVYKSGRLTAAATTFNQISEPMTIVMLMMMVMGVMMMMVARMMMTIMMMTMVMIDDDDDDDDG